MEKDGFDPPQDTTVAIQVLPHEDRAWQRVTLVREAYRDPDVSSVVDACRAAGVSRRTYYADLKRPYVQRMMLQEALALQEITLAVATRNWYKVMTNQVVIATDPKSRNSVGAARFIAERMDKAADALGIEDEIADATLDDLMQSFAAMPDAKKRVSATKKTKDGSVTLEVEGM